jgi:hypothetical protein
MPQAQTGKTKSAPKVVRVNAADGEAVLYRNLGNGRRLPFIWGTTVTLASGATSVVVSSGVSFNDHSVAEAVVMATPLSALGGAYNYHIVKDTVNNVVTLEGSVAPDAMDFDIMIMLGVGYNFDSTHTNQIWRRYYSN